MIEKTVTSSRAKPSLAGLVAAGLLIGSVAHAQYSSVVGWADMQNDANARTIQNFFFDTNGDLIVGIGGTVSGGVSSGHSINRVTGIGSSPSASVLMTSAQWGTAAFSPIRSFVPTATGVQFGNTGTGGGIFEYDFGTSTLTTRASVSDFASAVGSFTASVATGFNAAGDAFMWNLASGNRALLRVTGSTISTALDQTGLNALFAAATDQTIANIVVGLDGVIYIANSSLNSIAAYNPGTATGSVILDGAVLGTQTFQNMFAAPNGWIYFNGSNRNIYAFDPANPAGTFFEVINRATIEAGPAGSASIIQALGWYNGNIAWATGGTAATTATAGIYAVPEPSHYALLFGFLTVAVVAYRRRKA